MRAETRLPPLQYHDYPVDVYLRISQEDAHYSLEIHAVGRRLRCSIDMTQQDLLNLNTQLQQEMYAIARNSDRTPPTIAELATLAEIGHYAFNTVFSDFNAQAAINQLLSLNPRLTIQVASEDFFLPWELIYPFPLDELSFSHFWGMNHLISRVITKGNYSGAFISPQISINSSPTLGMLTYRGLDGVVQGELHFFQRLCEGGQITLLLLRSLDPQRKREEFREFQEFWQKNLHLAHFACHAFCNFSFPELSRILLSEEFEITLREMDAYGMAINGHPLITLNACETGTLNPLHTSNFAAAFLKYGARGVVATECAVPDLFAADFAEQLYTQLLTGQPLGESLLKARQYFFIEQNNPSGLLYSMYAHPSIRLVKTRGSNE